MSLYAPPRLSLRWIPVWRRNALVWQRLAIPSILGNLADPLIMLFGLGYGLGAMIGDFQGTSYFAWLAAGFVATSTMYAASFEALYSAFSRMHAQRTWEAILNAPVTLDDVLAGEYAWAATKALAAGGCMLIVVSAFGFARFPWVFAALPVIVLIGLAFAALGLAINALAHGYDFFSYYMTLVLTPMMMLSGVFFPIERMPVAVQFVAQALPVIVLIGLAFAALGLAINALAHGYDFFSYYMTLVLTPMMMLSGVFFPIERMPGAVQVVAQALPLHHGVAVIRPLLGGEIVPGIGLHLGVLAAYAAAGFYLATVLTRRRLLK